MRQIDANGILSTVVGTGGSCTPTIASCGDGGPALNATVRQVSGLAVDDAGNLFMKDSGAYRVRRVTATATGGLRGQLIAGPGYTITGQVTDDTGAPVPGTRVYLITADGYLAATTTGAAGWHPAADSRADAATVTRRGRRHDRRRRRHLVGPP